MCSKKAKLKKLNALLYVENQYMRALLKIRRIPYNDHLFGITTKAAPYAALDGILNHYDNQNECRTCSDKGFLVIDELDACGEHDRSWEPCDCVYEKGTKAYFKEHLKKLYAEGAHHEKQT